MLWTESVCQGRGQGLSWVSKEKEFARDMGQVVGGYVLCLGRIACENSWRCGGAQHIQYIVVAELN